MNDTSAQQPGSRDPLGPTADAEAERRCIEKLTCGFESLLVVFVLLVAVGAVLLALLPPDPPSVDASRFAWADVRPEPTERTIYVVAAVLGTCLCLCLPLVNRPRGSWSTPRMIASAAIAVAALGYQTVRFYQGHGAPQFDARLDSIPVAVALAAVAVALSCIRTQASSRLKTAAAALLSLVTAAVALPQRITLPAAIRDDVAHGWHLEAVLYPVVQTNGGGRCLIDYPPYYGCFGEWLQPWVRVFGQGLASVTGAFAALHVVAWIVIIVTLLVAIRHAVIAGAVALTLAVVYAMAGLAGPVMDPYIPYSPVRTLIPALSVGAVWWWTTRESRLATFLISIGVGLGVTWNYDGGLAATVAWLAFLAFDGLASRRGRRLRETARRLGLAAAGLGVALLALLLWLFANGGSASNLLSVAGVYATLIRGGLFQIPMPGLAHPWVAVVAIYGAGVLVGGARIAGWLDDRRDRLALYLGMLGIGLFSYYQARSAASNLAAVMWPAFGVYALLADRVMGRLARHSKVGRTVGVLIAWPAVLCGVMAVATAIVRAPNVAQTWHSRLSQIRAGADSDFARQAAFVRAECAGEPALIISIHQAALHAESGVPLARLGPGLSELLLVSENESIKERIARGVDRHVFLGQHPAFLGTPAMLLPPNDVIGRRYARAALDPSQTLMHLLRR